MAAMSKDNKTPVLYVDTAGSIHRSLVPDRAIDPDRVRPRKAILRKAQAGSFKKGNVETFHFQHLIVRPMDRISMLRNDSINQKITK
jgi:hypothetical protein